MIVDYSDTMVVDYSAWNWTGTAIPAVSPTATTYPFNVWVTYAPPPAPAALRPRKNWRWFHCYRPRAQHRTTLPERPSLTRARRFHKGSAADRRVNKRKDYLQALRT